MSAFDFAEVRRLSSKLENNVPVVHGNGFIQLWLRHSDRLHVWHPECPRQHTYTGIHDHRFSFRSAILRGRVVNRTWDECPGDAYDIWTPGREGPDTCSIYPTDDTCSLTNGHEEVYGPGEHYKMAIGQLHDGHTHSPKAATVMRLTGRDSNWPVRVLCPVGLVPDNEFTRDGFDPAWLWRLIEEVIG